MTEISGIIRVDSGAELMASLGGAITPAGITEILYKAKETRAAKDKAETQLAFQSAVGLMCGVGAICISPIGIVGAAAILAAGGHAAYEYSRKVKPFGDQAAKLEKVFNGAPTEQWAELARAIGPESFAKCIGAALLLTHDPATRPEDCYREAVRFAYNLGEHIEGYVPPERTALIAPAKKRDWRSELTEEAISEPTTTELEIVGNACKVRIHKKEIIGRIVALNKTGEESDRQRAMDLLLVHSGLSPRDVKELPRDRFEAVKKWAKKGAALPTAPALPATIAPSTLAIPLEEPTIAEPVVEVAAKPSFVSVAPVAVESIATAIVEEEVLQGLPVDDEEIEEEEEEEYIEEDEDEEESVTVEVVKEAVQPVVPIAAAKPAFFQAANIRQNTGLASTKELVEACMKEAYRSTTLIGGERSGKTYYASVFSARMKAERGTKITYINLFDANRDSANDWEHADHIITANLNDDRCDVQATFDRVHRRLREFQRETNTHLYFDEWVATTSRSNAWEKKASEDIRKANSLSGPGEYLEPEGIGTSAVEVMNLMSSIASELSNIGKKQLKAMWLISPALRASDIYEQGKVMKSLAPAIVIIPPGKTVKWTHPTGIVQEIGFDLARYQVSEVNLAIPKSNNIPTLECDRAIFIGGTWYSLDGLEAEKPELEIPVQAELFKNEPIAASEPTTIALEAEEDLIEDTIVEDAVSTDQEVEGIEDTTDRMRKIHAIMALDIPVELKTELLAKL